VKIKKQLHTTLEIQEKNIEKQHLPVPDYLDSAKNSTNKGSFAFSNVNEPFKFT